MDGSIADIKSATQEIRAEASAAATDIKVAGANAAGAVAATAKDIAITAKVNAALAADSSLKAMSINVDTQDGRVSMRGSAPDTAARDRAQALANRFELELLVQAGLTPAQVIRIATHNGAVFLGRPTTWARSRKASWPTWCC